MNVYKLKNGKKTGAFQLPIRDQMIAKKVGGEKVLKKIQYIPGSDSIFAEDHKGDDKPKAVWFDDGELRVSEENVVLNKLLQQHAWFDKHYYLVNEESEAKKEVSDFEILTKASNSIINETDKYKLQAMAMIVISLDAANWESFKCKAELLKYAKNHSKTLLDEMKKPDYESRLIAALSFNKEIVKYNTHRTAVVWNDEKEGVIVRVAEGETGIDKLGDFLGKTSESSTLVLQRIGEKTEATIKAIAPKVSGKEKTEAEIRAEIKAEYEAKYAKKEVLDTITAEPTEAVEEEELDIEALRVEYKTVTGRELSPRYLHDAEWMKGKIADVKNS